MSKFIEASLLSAFLLTTTQITDANDGAEFGARLPSGREVGIDCDLLDSNGRETPEFLEQLGVDGPGHLKTVRQRALMYNLDLMTEYKEHLRAHSITEKSIDFMVDTCADYPRND